MKNYVYVPHMTQIPQWKQCYYDYKTLNSIQSLLNACSAKYEIYDGVLKDSATTDKQEIKQSMQRLRSSQDIGLVSQKSVGLRNGKEQLEEIIEQWCREFIQYSDQCSEMVDTFVNMKEFQVKDKLNQYKKFYLVVRSMQDKITMLMENLYLESSYLLTAIEYNIAQESLTTSKFQEFLMKHYGIQTKFVINKKLKRLKRVDKSLISQIQAQYVLHSEENSSQAFQTLQQLNAKQQHSSDRQLRIGLVMGVLAFMVLVLSISDYVTDVEIEVNQVFTDNFPIWRGASYVLFYLWLLGGDIFFYEKSQINYRLIFQFENHNMPQSKMIFYKASTLTLIYLVLFYVFTLQVGGHLRTEFVQFGIIFWGILIFSTIVLAPLTASNKKSGRYLFFRLLANAIMTPCIPINFMIIWMTEQLASFNQPFGDFYYTICFVSTKHAPTCASTSSYASTAYIMTVFLYRMIQNLKLWHQITMKKPDKKYDFKAPQFLGFFRGFFAFCTSLFSLLDRLKLYQGSFEVWLVFSIISTLYSWFIDVRFDWGILNIHQKNCMRQKLLFPKAKPLYYFIAFFNLILRAAWILNISSLIIIAPGFSNMLFTMGISYLQILRRGIWNILRIENEHIKNCGEFRATISDQDLLQEVRLALKQKQQELQAMVQKQDTQKSDNRMIVKKKLSNTLTDMSIRAQQTAKLSECRTKSTKQLFKQRLQKLSTKKADILAKIEDTRVALQNL